MGRDRRLPVVVAALGLVAAVQAGAPDALEPGPAQPGAVLRAALAAAREGRVEEAADALVRLARQHPEIADHAASLEADLWLEAERADDALRAAGSGLARSADSPIRYRLHRAVGDARLMLGAEAAARQSWEAALAADPPADYKAALRLAIADSLAREERLDAAARAYAKLWIEQPTAAQAKSAEERLAALEARLDSSFRDARDWRRRADGLFRRHHTAEALAAYDRALAAGLSAVDRRRAERQRAHCLFRLRRYAEATKAFAALGGDAESRLWQARSRARNGQVERAIRELEAIGKNGRGRDGTAIWARLLAALLLEDEGALARSRALYASVANVRSRKGLANAALWRLGWTAYRERNAREARQHFERLVERDDDPIGRLRPRYWAARALEALDPEAAQREFEALARDYPFTYYGWRAAQRSVGTTGPNAAAPPFPRGSAALPERELARPRILLEAGLRERALDETSRLEGRARGLEDRLELARLYADAGDFQGARRVLVIPYAEALARGPAAGLEEVWWLAWPDAYAELVRGALAGDAVIGPELVFAVMREESGYQPDAISSAGALGLLQIMPTTGSRLAQELGLNPFQANDLLLPPVNIRLGGFYLDGLTRRFDGNLAAAVASYNAGPEAVARWLATSPLEDDEWVEAVPYSQTRAYVKRVLRSLQVYQVLY